ncbi:unnamed protein product [Thelazia callipaeda]|uniref:MFS domain-containing protein n=1 Tax=Thelazia callipaeda TaxID=103827 RepID=A0A0N5CTJ9_THECL|nr:unnamed protein product [Thelazia callipaeda]
MELINMADPRRLKDLEAGKELKCAVYVIGTSIASFQYFLEFFAKVVTNEVEKIHKFNAYAKHQLLCSNPFIQEAKFWIFSVGASIAVPTASHLSDRYCRRPILLIAMYLSTVFSCVTAFSSNLFVFLALRVLIGAAVDTYLTAASIPCCEVVAGSFREWISFIGVTSWVHGYLYLGVSESSSMIGGNFTFYPRSQTC